MGELFSQVDWRSVLIPGTPILEIVVRGSAIYLGTFLLLRVILKRESGSVGITDLIVIVFIADAAQNAMADDYRAVPDGLLLVATLIFWALLLDVLAYKSPRLARILKPRPLLLVKNGRLIPPNMRREFITEDELLGQLRLQGIDDVGEVREAFMESDGRFSVITRKDHQHESSDTPTT